jgi:hypothetical protein
MVETMSIFYYFHYKNSDPVINIDQDAIVEGEVIPCPLDPGHPGTGGIRINDLVVILRSPKVRDISSTWHNDYLITDQAALLFKKQGFTGYTLRQVEVKLPRTDRYRGVQPPVLWEFKVTGWGGFAPESSGIKLVTVCPGCCYTHYTSFSDPEKLIDESQWDGSDFFFIWPTPHLIFITERVKGVAEANKLSGVEIITLDRLKGDKWGFSPGKLRDHIDPERAKKLGGHLGID